MDLTPLEKLLDLSGKTALVTGGARGIGLGITTRLAQAGANVVIADLRKDDTEKANSELKEKGFKSFAVLADVSNPDHVNFMVDQAVKTFGTLDILVNNAGIFPSKLLSDMSIDDFDKVLQVNLKGVYLTTKKASEQMIKQGKGGKIINITSIDALHPSSSGLAHYDASKHGVWGFTKNIALELAAHKIWVNAIAPGGIATPGVAEASQNQVGVDMSKMMESFLAKIPMKRMGEPDDIGKVALFLASEMSSYMNGSQIVVDGGVLLS